MAICYFDQDYDNQFKCDYKIKEDLIQVTVIYNIEDEIEPINGCICVGNSTNYKKRDILIYDAESSNKYLLKDSYYSGVSNRYGSLDDLSKTKFCSSTYFISNDFDKLRNLPKTPKIKRIKIFSKDIINLFGSPSVTRTVNGDEYILSCKKERQFKSITVNRNNIKTIKIEDTWESNYSQTTHCINIDLNGYIELDLVRRTNYTSVNEFVYEVMVFMQLYHPDKFIINKLSVFIDDGIYEIVVPIRKLAYKEKHTEISVNIDLLEYLHRCYTSIPYRNSKTEIRNISYIIMNTSREIEDNFLMLYRFIECYYKKQNISCFIEYSIKNNFKDNRNLDEEKIEKYSQEIISLRNQYVHAGYYIKNSSLRITFDKINRKKNPKDYTANIDFEWIYKRTEILYDIVIDIIFRNMLDCDIYEFNRHF